MEEPDKTFDRLTKFEEQARERTARAKTLTKARSAQNEMARLAPLQMSLWHEDTRAICNEITRSALFSGRDPRKPRLHYSNAALYMLGDDAAITYTGEELREVDQEVWLAFAHAARNKVGGKIVVTISNAQICAIAGWPARQLYYTEIYKAIQRLTASNLTIYSRRLKEARAYEKARRDGASEEQLAELYDRLKAEREAKGPLDKTDIGGVMLSMLGKADFEQGTHTVDNIPQGNLTWTVELDEEMVSLYAKPFLTIMPASTRRVMSWGGKLLTAYYMGHSRPFPVYISRLIELLNLESTFKASKRVVINKLEELKANGILEDYKLDEGRGDVRVHVVRARWTQITDESGMVNDSPSGEGT